MTVFVRLFHGVREHFPARAMEWQLAAMSLGLGILLYQEREILAPSPTLVGLTYIASELNWARGLTAIGAARLFALIVNGTFAHTWYGSISPYTRCATAFLACFAWLTFTVGLANSPLGGVGVILFPVLLFSDIYNIFRSAGDAAMMNKMRNLRQNG